jgi:hypothetical protein
VFLDAFRTNAVAELGIGMLVNVALEFLPGLLVVTDAVAMHADRQNALKGFDFRGGYLQFPNTGG